LAWTLEPITFEPITLPPLEEPRAAAVRSTHQDRLVFADAFRTVAILGVVASHLALISGLRLFGQRDDLAYVGAWGVNCFFVLSGFLLSRPYLEAIIGTRPMPSTRLFLTRRFLRIYPLYAVAVVVSAAAAYAHRPHHLPVGSVVSHLTFLHGFAPTEIFTLNGPLWTMAVDAQFYLLLPLGAFALAALARRAGHGAGVRLIAGAIAAAIVLSIGLRWFVFARYSLSITHDPIGPAFVLARNAIGMGTAFALGIAIALIVLLGRQPNRLIASIIALAGIACFGVLAWAGRTYPATDAYGVLYDALGAISGALILYGFAEGGFNVIGLVRRSRLIATVAALAYAVYLFHYLVIDTVLGLIGKRVHWVPGTPAYVIGLSIPTLLATFAVAYVAHRFVEKPFLTLRDRNREPAVRTR
jgi:peptidoglycan/LPS O-acetylase OafA/YrhL